MSKDIRISEGRVSRTFNTIQKIKIHDAESGDIINWIPEEEAADYVDLAEKTITRNGTYKAKDENKDGYSKVRVNVEGGGGELITKSITENGTYSAQDDNADGYSTVTVNVSGGGGGPQGTEVQGTAVTDITAMSTVYVNNPVQQSAQVVSSNIPSFSYVGYANGKIAFKTNSTQSPYYGALYTLDNKDYEPVKVFDITSNINVDIKRKVQIIKDGSSYSLAAAGEATGSLPVSNASGLTYMGAGYTIVSIDGSRKLVDLTSLGVQPGLAPADSRWAVYPISGSEVFSIHYVAADNCSKVRRVSVGGEASFYPINALGVSYVDSGQPAGQYNALGNMIVAKTIETNGTRALHAFSKSGGDVTDLLGKRCAHIGDINHNVEGSKIWVMLGSDGLAVINSSGVVKIYTEIQRTSDTLACMFGDYFWDGYDLWRLDDGSGYTIGPTSSKNGGDMLGYVTSNILQGQIGTAIVLFT